MADTSSVSDNDYFTKPWWPFRMTIAWILTRSDEFANQMAFSRRAHGIDSSLERRWFVSRPLEQYFESGKDAQKAFFSAAKSGEIRVRAVLISKNERQRLFARPVEGPVIRMSPDDFNRIYYDVSAEEDVLVAFYGRRLDATAPDLRRFGKIEASRNDVLKCFPADETPARQNQSASIISQKVSLWENGSSSSFGKIRSRRGPRPGAISRYGKKDKALYPEMDRLIDEAGMTVSAAARHLAYEKKVAGTGTLDSCAERLARAYRRDRRK